MRHIPPDPYEEWEQPIGDVPPGESGWLQEPVAEHFDRQKEAWQEMLPNHHEPVTKINGEEVPVGNIVLRAGKKAYEYSAVVRHEAGEHKKEVIVATLTVAGALLAIKSIHARRKNS